MLKTIKDFPNLRNYYNTYLQRNGKPEHEHCFPNLLIWFRDVIDNDDDMAIKILEMDEDEIEEFGSWGHNSRWVHVAEPAFSSLMEADPEYMKGVFVQLALDYGKDPDVEAKYFGKKDDKNDK